MPMEVLWIVLPILLLITKSSFALVSIWKPSVSFVSSHHYFSAVTATKRTATTLLLSSSNDSDGAADDDSKNSESLSYNKDNDDENIVVDPVVQLPLLEAKFAVATTPAEREDLQGKIDNAKMAGEFGVRKAQVDFYTAFSTGNLEAMQDVWSSSSSSSCRCVHPGMPSMVGRDATLESWASIFQGGGPGGGFTIEPADTTIDICGTTAICNCVERINGGESGSFLEAINIYKREHGSWKMTFHMASPFLAANRVE
jgi:hypothetical protein